MEGVFDRMAWLKIVGLPVNLWNEENFYRIASEFDKAIEPVKIPPSIQDLSLGNICILIEKKRINDEVLVEINRNIINVGVMESECDWSPFPFGPVDMLEVYESEEDLDISINLDENVLEEGEIKYITDDNEEGISETNFANESEAKKRGCWCRCHSDDGGSVDTKRMCGRR
ncbi:unnamed protein product [Lactuca saligna]|uniref:DUF4283 domain-containing protein n=1 Tax=Lactuca saligna TaxID=75948 RepID=A0AA35ZEG2_LACSI|nr:unnamed protein product [Lactuca saligna]